MATLAIGLCCTRRSLGYWRSRTISHTLSVPLAPPPTPRRGIAQGKLKQSQAEGRQLERNQLEKIEKEQEIINEINALKLDG